ncbi:MAG: cytochrome d ubiquinol oxidase subunit II [Acidimicrobiia bacterium]
MSTVVALILFFGVVAYAIFGGADFGAGFWDLVAGGAERGKRPRALVDHAIGPVWEANHVWLIFVLVVLWTAFPSVFASIMLTLFVPMTLAALGIVARGSSFAFRKNMRRLQYRRVFGAMFATSSVVVPFCIGAVVGGIASGRVPSGGTAGDPWQSWLNPTSILGGVLAVLVCAFLAATYLAHDASRLGQPDLVDYFTRRAFVMALITGAVAFAGIFVLRADDAYLFDGLTTRALPLIIVSALCGVGSLVVLWRGAQRYARLLAIGAVGAVVCGWGVAQWPYMLPETVKIAQAAAPDATLWSVVIVFGLAAVICVPSLALLYVLDQRGELDGDTADLAPDAASPVA